MEVPPKNFMAEDEHDGNFVVIQHENDEFFIYSHLKANEIKVNLGDNVKTGEILGYNGHTGWSIEPHLHFMVFKLNQNLRKILRV